MDSLNKAGVLGGGMMGAEIALCFAMADIDVAIKDVTMDVAKAGIDRASRALDKLIKRGSLSLKDKDRVLARMHPVDSYERFADADFVVEAVLEDLKVKKDAFAAIDGVCKADCIFATNTSSLRVTAIATGVGPERRRRFLGTHFFSPVSLMKLVEVVPGLETDAQVVDTAMEVCRAIGKTPIWTKDVAGFAVNRVLHAMMIEAERCVEEGVASAEDIDLACKIGLGHPVGPFQLMDLVTNELILDIQNILQEAYGSRFMPRPVLKQKVDAGHSGRKTGRGWFDYGST